LSVRSLYPYDGQRAEDLSFSENVVISAHPSKSGDDWWHGTLVSNGKRGFFPASYVVVIEQVTHARALFTYHSSSAEELSFNEDDTLSIVERSEGDWWKAQKDGSVFLVPAAYLEVVNVTTPTSPTLNRQASDNIRTPGRSRGDNDDYSEHSQYHSFSESDDEQQSSSVKPEDTEVEFQLKAAERAHILEAAGLILKMDKTEPPPPRPTRRRSAKNRRTPPLPPQKEPSPSSARYKELPPIPSEINNSVLHDDDAFDRYEQYRQQQSSIQGMSSPPSVTSIDNVPPSPASASYSFVSIQSKDDSSHRSGGSSFLLFLQKAGSRATTALSTDRKSTLTISAPVISAPMADAGTSIQRSNTPAFGSSWSSLVDESALEGIPSMERRRQEAMFELITTESGYVHDLQLIIETFYAPLLKILTEKESVGVFANIEELLLCNTAFLSSLEGRQKESRLYIDSISDILEEHAPGFDIYAGYCVGQGPAIKLLQTLRETKPDLDAYLQETRNDPATRNLDLSSYLLIPMQRITRYPLLLKQISANTQGDEDRKRIDSSIHTIERILDNINERIREREGQERLASVSKNLWIGQGRLDLTAATRYMGRRTLVKEGVLIKAKSGRRLRAFLCNDVLVLTDESANSIYRMASPPETRVRSGLAHLDDSLFPFQISVAYPRGGDIIKLKATSIKECQDWIRAIGNASAECRRADRRASHTSF
ncbi:Dbl homology domain-containing protein, partial [Cantharellus anzutake]|uniref:Dbl homology domain-containing protein n=1 Tax=Cantharellus anzutake TaxID=1750568 RepID=UPI001908BD49